MALNNLALRVLSASVLAPLAVCAVARSGGCLDGLVIVIAVLAVGEWLRLADRTSWRRYVFMAAAPLIALAWAHHGGVAAGFAASALMASASALFARGCRHPAPLLVAAGVGYACLLAACLWSLGSGHHASRLAWLFAVIWSSDIGGYVIGRLCKGPKLAPRVSPGKTWSGLVGAAAFATIAGSLATYLGADVVTPSAAGLLGGLLGLVGQAGDLLESALKRRAGVKDSSSLIPGHGGVLDRVDALMAAAPCLAVLLAVL